MDDVKVARWIAVGLGLLWVSVLVPLNACNTLVRQDPLRRGHQRAVVDDNLELARRYAPWVYHAAHASLGRQDLPCPVDFDGDLSGDNHWDNMPFYELLPTLYYAVLETESHWFVSYHLFHARDWTHLDLGLHLTHEGDGENLQVVVEKASAEVVLLYTQAHYRGQVHGVETFASGSERLRSPLHLVDREGRVGLGQPHAAIYVEQGGHGIYAVAESRDVGMNQGRLALNRPGWIFRPARPGEEVVEPDLPMEPAEVLPYRLESTLQKLWPGVRDGTMIGAGRMFDGTVCYEDARVKVDLPRYYQANRFSGPFGPDRGIAPFAMDFAFKEGDLGSLFFDPARRYLECLSVPQPWSTNYLNDPFVAD
jgi:hypothetical protein